MQFIVETDTLDYTLAAILFIINEENEVHLVTFHSCTFTTVYLNYDICCDMLEHQHFSFLFIYFSWWCGCCHMTYHIMWGYRPRLDKSWYEETKRMILGHMYTIWCPCGRHNMNTWWKYRLHMYIRVELFIISTDHEYFV